MSEIRSEITSQRQYIQFNNELMLEKIVEFQVLNYYYFRYRFVSINNSNIVFIIERQFVKINNQFWRRKTRTHICGQVIFEDIVIIRS